MTIEEIIPLAYRGCPPVDTHDAIREAMEAEGRRLAEARPPIGGGRRGNPGGENRAARTKRDAIRARVWELHDAGLSYKASGRLVGVAKGTIARIISEGREPAERRSGA